MGPTYQRPDLPEVDAFRGGEESPSTESLADLPWWEIFDDSTLRWLIGEALAANGDLKAAAARVEVARAQAGIARDALYPSLSGQVGAVRQRAPGLAPNPIATTNRFNVSAVVGWEIDVWGRLRRAAEAATADYGAVLEQERGVVVMLVADLAQAYVELLELDAAYRLSREARDARADLLGLFTAQLEAGTGTLIETANAEALLYDVEATLAQLEAATFQKENQISILMGRPPGAIARGPPLDGKKVLPEIPAGLPSSLLGRRPDLRELEQRVRAAVARIGVADANFYPPIGLTGAFGWATADLGTLVQGSSQIWNFGANTSWLAPVLGGRRLRDERDAAVAAAEDAAATWRQAVLGALGDVAAALSNIESARVTSARRDQQVGALDQRLRLVLDSYRGGVASYVEVTLAYQDLLPAQLAQTQARAQRLISVIQLYRVLGGGWQQETADLPAQGSAVEGPPGP